jgi:hypothetical protein
MGDPRAHLIFAQKRIRLGAHAPSRAVVDASVNRVGATALRCEGACAPHLANRFSCEK